MTTHKPFRVGAVVDHALQSRTPVVALETALVTHGLPRPRNIETAIAMEDNVRSSGAVPATIGILHGEIIVGMTREELTALSEVPHPLKASSRGLPYVLATGNSAGLTVSGTAWLAARAGIDIFATGGIGGVHHGAEETGDISTDLWELAGTPVAVICSGVKSILDIGRTLEYLETAGVPVYGYQTDEFPAFFSGASGYDVPFRLEDPEHAARIWIAHRTLDLGRAAIVACPPPVEVEDDAKLQHAIDQANQEAREQRVTSGDVTPFVLRRIAEITDGASIEANVALLKHNARIAGEIAVAGQPLLPDRTIQG